MNVIEISNLTKFYGKQRGIEAVSLQIPHQSIFGFIGPNGAGKSTTMRILMNLIFPTSGSARVLGCDVVEQAYDIKHLVGYLPADINLYTNLTVDTLLQQTMAYYVNSPWQVKNCPGMTESIYHHKKQHRRQLISAEIDQISEVLQLDRSRRISDLSFGNRKKLGIILSMLHKPSVLLLDEPTGGLDPLVQEHYFDYLKQKNKEGVTIFFSSHILSEVEKICDKVAIIKEGGIIRSENIEDLKERYLKKVRLVLKVEDGQKVLEAFKDHPIKIDQSVADDEQGTLHLTFIYHLPVAALLHFLEQYEVKDILIQEPNLSEIFLHYYS